MPAEVVTFEHVTRRYGPVLALDDVSLSIAAGEVVALLGPNGAGRTTAISIMLGLRRASSGSARLFGMQPTDLRARSRCGVMLQESGTLELLTVREIVRLFATYYPRRLPEAEALRLAGLEDLAGTRLDRLSGGQRQRLLVGSLPLFMLGLAIGYLVTDQAATAIVNLVGLPMFLASGILIPLRELPDFVQAAAPYLPAYRYGQLAWGAVGAHADPPLTDLLWLAAYTAVFVAIALR